MSTFGKIVWALILVPVALVTVVNVFSDGDKAQLRKERLAAQEAYHQYVAAAADLKAVRMQLLEDALAGEAENEVAVQEIAATPILTPTPKSEPTESVLDRRKHLERAAAEILAAEPAGSIVTPQVLAGISVGDQVTSVASMFGMPDIVEPTERRTFFREGWPGQEQGTYEDERVSFVFAEGVVQQILVGIGHDQLELAEVERGEPVKRVLTGTSKKGATLVVRDISDGSGEVIDSEAYQALEESYGTSLLIVEVLIDNTTGKDSFTWWGTSKAVTSEEQVLTPVGLLSEIRWSETPDEVLELFRNTTIAAGEKKRRALAFPIPANGAYLKQVDLKDGFLFAGSCM